MSLDPKTRLGPYEIIAALGSGGMGEVYRARDDRLGRDVALKVLSAHLTQDPAAVDRFIREARAASALNHPHIVTIHDIGGPETGHFIVMELVAGQTLRALILERPAVEVVIRVGEQIAKALAAAHAAGIVHRDIKPENVMVRDDGYVKVLDFGLARLLPHVEPTSASEAVTAFATEVGTLLGTARYMSPEQARGDPIDAATDIFSLGLVLYELATAVHPFAADSFFSVLHRIVSEPAQAPTRVLPGIPSVLDRLLLQMLDKDPPRRPTAHEVADTLAALGQPERPVARRAAGRATRHTVGRQHERADLHSAFERVAAGSGLLVCVAGEPGIGKTTLIEDFLGELAAGSEPCYIARGRCSERLAGTEAYLPVFEALENLARGGNESVLRAMRLLAPTWYAQIGPRAGTESDRSVADMQAASQERMKREIGAFLQDVGRQRPLVLFFDDVQWADVSTIELLAYLAMKFDATRLLVLATYRPAELLSERRPFLLVKLDLEARGLAREIVVPFLRTGDIERYLALEFPSHRFPAAFSTLIHARTEGSPLFVVDLLRYLRDRGAIVQEDGYWVLAHAVPDIERELPASIRSMIQRKIEQVDEADRRLLVAASVQGYEFDSAVVAATLSMDAADVEERLDVLDRVHGFARRVDERAFPDGELTLRYRFVHVLYQNALYASLMPARKTSMSSRVAQALLDHYAERTEEVASELAFLLEIARDFARAVDYFQVAAERAARLSANQEAELLARRGLELLAALPVTPERLEKNLLMELLVGYSLAAIKGYSARETGESMMRAYELCQRIGETPRLFAALWGLWAYYAIQADYRTGRPLAERTMRMAEAARDPVLEAGACHALGWNRLFQGDLVDGYELLERGSTLYDPRHQQVNQLLYRLDPGIFCLIGTVRSLWLLGYPEQAERRMKHALELGRTADPRSYGEIMLVAEQFYCWVGELDKTIEWGENAAAHCDEHGFVQDRAWASIWLGWAQARQGLLAHGIATMRDSLNTLRTIQSGVDLPYHLGLLAEVLAIDGQVSDALTTIDEALAVIERTDERWYAAEVLRLKGEFSQMRGDDPAETERFLQQACDTAREQSARSLELRAAMSLARLLRDQDRRDEAHRTLAGIYSWFTEGFETRDLQEARALLDELP